MVKKHHLCLILLVSAVILSSIILPAAGIEAETYSILTDAPAGLKPGQSGDITVKIKAKQGFKINNAYPIKLKMSAPPDGIQYKKLTLKREDGMLEADGKIFVFKVPVTAVQAGTFRVKGELKFSVCNDSRCVIEKKTITANMVVH
ncbi:MAG: hypothetical protein ABIH00_00680 [Armatimonadota bacterium]